MHRSCRGKRERAAGSQYVGEIFAPELQCYFVVSGGIPERRVQHREGVRSLQEAIELGEEDLALVGNIS